MSLSHTPDPEETPSSAPQPTMPTDRFLAVMQESADLFWILSSIGTMDDISPSWLSFTGQQEHEARGNGWLDAVYAVDRPSLETFLAQPISVGQPFEHSCHLRRIDGIYRLMRLRAFPVRTVAGTVRELVMSGTDITAEHMNEAQIHLALETSGVGLWRYHLGTHLFAATEQWKRLYGLALDAPVTFERFLELVYTEDRARIEDVMTRVRVEPIPHDVQFRITRPDGSVRWILSRLQSLSEVPNQPGRLIGSALDITETKEAEEQITQILESITDAFVHLDQEWCITYANRRFNTLTGLNWATVLGQSLWEVRPQWRGGLFELRLRTAMETQQATDFDYVVPDTHKWAEVHVYPTKDGLAIYGNDITERKRAEAALWEIETRFRHFVDANLLGILVHDWEGAIFEANDKFLSLIDATREEVITASLHMRDLTPGEYQARDQQAREELLATGTYLPFEKIYHTREGKQVPVLVGGTLMHPEHASSSRILSFALDLTAQKELERQAQFFLSMTSHELKTPLTALKGMFQLLQRKEQRLLSTVPNLKPETRDFLEALSDRLADAARQVDLQTRFINDLLDVSQIQTNTLHVEMQRCDVLSIVKTTIADLRMTVPEHTLQLVLPEQTTVSVLADPDRLRQVLTNYVTNALRYSKPSLPIVIGVALQENHVRVWVRDQGPGLTAEAKAQIWQRYRQVKSTPIQSVDLGKGLGLGLYICQMLIAQHHGEVGVESTPGEGSTFWFTLPTISEGGPV
ncbi:MAG TPA: PAS domain S-box protein [Ktedonobacteraceae bacterium]|nr:PAS domain S-box protein [Ktedonobacteraceae bacterium]